VDIDWIHRPSGPEAIDGTLNLCFQALDRHVVHGRADEVALRAEREVSYARLLEDVAAFGGLLQAFGTAVGDRVVSGLPPGREGLVAALATARVGALHVHDPAAGAVVLVGDTVIRRDEDWDLLMRAGRTDPAACAEVPAGAPAYESPAGSWTALEALSAREAGWPLDAVVTLVAGRTVTMDP
jgi:hypothetical protein